MSSESMTARKRKRIIEIVVSGFSSATDAIRFGNTVDKLVEEMAGKQKFRQEIGTPESMLAITEKWTGDTVLRMRFLELRNNNLAVAVCDQAMKTVVLHKRDHPKDNIRVEKQLVLEKPQPQFIGA